jgi:phosphoribosylaminoimidazole-succinocarboxamide synthase
MKIYQVEFTKQELCDIISEYLQRKNLELAEGKLEIVGDSEKVIIFAIEIN